MKNKQIAIVIILAAIMTACGGAPEATPEATQIPIVVADDTIIAEGRVEPTQYAEIAFSTNGVVSEVLVKDGEPVIQGQLLIRLGSSSDTNYANALLELATAQQAWDDLVNSRDEEFAQATIELKDAKEDRERAYQYLVYLQNDTRVPQTQLTKVLKNSPYGYYYETKAKNLKGPAPEDWIIEAENDLALKQAKLDQIQLTYDNLKDGPNADQLPVVEARLNAAKASVAAFEVNAPFDGVIAEIDVQAGSTINAGDVAVSIADTSDWIVVTTDVTEIDVVDLEEGQPVTVKLDALPDVELSGKILSIGQGYQENQGDIVYKVAVLLTESDPAMRWGMTAVVTFK